MICKFCGKEFTPIQKTQKYCSKQCSKANKNHTMPPGTLQVCQHCGKTFTAPSKRKYCSTQCSYQKHKIQPKTTKQCPKCGATFIANKRQKYCSAACRLNHHAFSKTTLQNTTPIFKDKLIINSHTLSKATLQNTASIFKDELTINGTAALESNTAPELKTFICEFCETAFVSKRKRKYCSSDCRLLANGKQPLYCYERELLNERAPKAPPTESLAEANAKARELGLSYGEYISLQYLKKRKLEE